jgi:hypothetical protein
VRSSDHKSSDHDGGLSFKWEFLIIPNCILPIAEAEALNSRAALSSYLTLGAK